MSEASGDGTTFSQLLSQFAHKRALVVGDLMLDEYIFGRATRISQEAPVMVVRQDSTQAVPGGAANVAANMVALGASAALVGVTGADSAGDQLALALQNGGISASGLVRDADRITTRKTRVLANHSHQVLRIDHEDIEPVSKATEDQLLARFRHEAQTTNVILVSDYQKGGVTARMIPQMVEYAKELGVPVLANPKPNSLKLYAGATLVSLNRYEGATAVNQGDSLSDAQALPAAHRLRTELGVENVVITLGASGMVVATPHGGFHIPAILVAVYDEAGAGDTVIATVALGVACGAISPTLFALAAQTAGCVVRKVGVATPTQEDLSYIRSL